MYASVPFHLAIPVHDLDAARDFYGRVLGLPQGRSSDTWIDWNLFGHQLVTHLAPSRSTAIGRGHVDGVEVPIPHFGLVLSPEEFNALASRLQAARVEFLMEPAVRYQGKPAEQATMFLFDPSGNALEFKAYTHPEHLFTPGTN
jgi:extradiol dioxygenase family protein